jgi:hypothetical protein
MPALLSQVSRTVISSYSIDWLEIQRLGETWSLPLNDIP